MSTLPSRRMGGFAFAWCPYKWGCMVVMAGAAAYGLYVSDQRPLFQAKAFLGSLWNWKYSIPVVVAIHAVVLGAAVLWTTDFFDTRDAVTQPALHSKDTVLAESASEKRFEPSKQFSNEFKSGKVLFTIELSADPQTPWLFVARANEGDVISIVFKLGFSGRYAPQLFTYRRPNGYTGVIVQERSNDSLLHSYSLFNPMAPQFPLNLIRKLELDLPFEVVSTTFVIDEKGRFELYGLVAFLDKDGNRTGEHQLYSWLSDEAQPTWFPLATVPKGVVFSQFLIEQKMDEPSSEMASFIIGDYKMLEGEKISNRSFVNEIDQPGFIFAEKRLGRIALQTGLQEGILGEDAQQVFVRDSNGLKEVAFSENDFRKGDRFFLQNGFQESYIFQRTPQGSGLYRVNAAGILRKIGQFRPSVVFAVVGDMSLESPLLSVHDEI